MDTGSKFIKTDKNEAIEKLKKKRKITLIWFACLSFWHSAQFCQVLKWHLTF